MGFDKNMNIDATNIKSRDHMATITISPTLITDKEVIYDIHGNRFDMCECGDDLETALGKVEQLYQKVKYEIVNTPEGTLIDYSDKEIRIMCPTDTKWTKQSVGATGNPNMYYMGFKAYAPKGAVSFKEGDRGEIIDEMFTFDNAFAGTDELGRNYSICWLALASYDEASDTWTYFGKNSTSTKFIGWSYVVEWYDANGHIIESDYMRINLTNEQCHYSVEYYDTTKVVEKAVETANTYTDEQINKYFESVEDATDEDIENLFK